MNRCTPLLLVLTLNLLAGPAFAAGDELTIIHIDIGQGDSTLILGPEDDGGRVAILMDAGDRPGGASGVDGGLVVQRVFAEYGIDHLDYVIASHFDADHISGFVGRGSHGVSCLLGPNNLPGNAASQSEGFEDATAEDPEDALVETGDDIVVGTFLDHGEMVGDQTQAFRKWKHYAKDFGDRVSISTRANLLAFEPIQLGDGATMTLVAANGYVRDPDGGAHRVVSANTENERSLAFWINYEAFDYYIGGDLIGRTYASENAKLEAAVGDYLAPNAPIEVIRTNHHGANNTSAKEFLAALAPSYAIISVGVNSYGHPHRDHLQRLVDAGIETIYQTNRGEPADPLTTEIMEHQLIANGHIIVSSDGEDYWIETVQRAEADD